MLIADGVHRIDCPLGDRVVALYLLAGQEATLLVDTGVRGSVPEVLLPYMRSRGLAPERVRYVLTTHCDFDHVGGAAEALAAFPRALLLCHRLDRAMTEDVDLTLAYRYGEFVAAHGYDDTTAEGKARIRSVTGTALVDLALTGGERLRLAPDWEVEVLHTPGHSPGSVSVWDPRGQVLLIGDAVLGSGLLTRHGAPAFPPTYRGAEAYRATIDRMEAMAIEVLGTAHYPLYRGGAAAEFLALSRAYADRVETAVLGALESVGRPLATREIIEVSRAALGPWDEATAMALMYPVVGHLELLAGQGAVRADATGPLTRWARTAR